MGQTPPGDASSWASVPWHAIPDRTAEEPEYLPDPQQPTRGRIWSWRAGGIVLLVAITAIATRSLLWPGLPPGEDLPILRAGLAAAAALLSLFALGAIWVLCSRPYLSPDQVARARIRITKDQSKDVVRALRRRTPLPPHYLSHARYIVLRNRRAFLMQFMSFGSMAGVMALNASQGWWFAGFAGAIVCVYVAGTLDHFRQDKSLRLYEAEHSTPTEKSARSSPTGEP